MSNNTNRRDFIGYSFSAVATVGVGASLYGMKKAWDPLPSVLAAGFTTIDLNAINLKPGEPQTFKWRGKPVFILEKTSDMENYDGDLVLNNKRYTIAIGLCTHLGCIPAWKKSKWKCACHGGEFDASGKQTFGPPPKPLIVPPFSVKGSVITLGNNGNESKNMMDARA